MINYESGNMEAKRTNEWEIMELRLGHYMISKVIDGKIYWRID